VIVGTSVDFIAVLRADLKPRGAGWTFITPRADGFDNTPRFTQRRAVSARKEGEYALLQGRTVNRETQDACASLDPIGICVRVRGASEESSTRVSKDTLPTVDAELDSAGGQTMSFTS
jgi:hypothetical protein